MEYVFEPRCSTPRRPPVCTPQDDLLWRQLAENKWGTAVRDLARVPRGGWRAWAMHRLCRASAPGLSPLDLVQVRAALGTEQWLVGTAAAPPTAGSSSLAVLRC